jgi:3',5'-cyclic AMP phosphodiesterase CpdA
MILILLLLKIIACEYRNKILLSEDGELTILQLTDLHYGENIRKDINSTILTESLINFTNPDIVVITGDLVSGYAWDGSKTSFFKSSWELFTSAMSLPYAYVMGNHDSQGDLSRKQIIELDKTHNYSLINSMQGDYSNYYIPIYAGNGKVALILWMFDTNSEGCENMEDSWGCFEKNEIDWYENESKLIEERLGYMPNGLAFFHIPLPEYRVMHNWNKTYGSRNEIVSCPRKNTGLFKSLLNTKNIKATFCGHDHDNDEGGNFFGIELVFGRKTGVGGYGPSWFQRGGRVIKIKVVGDDFDYTHHIIQEDGTIQYNCEPTWKGGYDYVDRCAK